MEKLNGQNTKFEEKAGAVSGFMFWGFGVKSLGECSKQASLRGSCRHATNSPGQVKLQQLQLNAKQSMLDFKHQEADDLKSQLSQVVKQRNARHFGLHSLFPLLFLLLFLVHLWVFSDILPGVLGIRDCLLAPP